ncbi:MAG: toll/interleukin-1 receptor domain-containing protein [Coriobacteriales bacterium]|nr:toll/interleukin-1 receptor domain-containing protein [Coriobacteriales bacterium]
MPGKMPEVYEGDRPFIFVSYAHADSDAVIPIITDLDDEGYRVWYDKGIQACSTFPDYIADHVHDCECFLMLISHASLVSDWCKNEVNYAIMCRKKILPVYLEDVELPRGLEIQLGTVQALFWYGYKTDAEFNEALFAVPMLDTCLKPEGKRRRGVKPRMPKP